MTKKPTNGIVVDAAHSIKRGVTEYRGIDLETGEQLFYENIGNQTTNIGEFLAIVDAMKYIIKHNCKYKVVYSDSTTAINWINNKRTGSSKPIDSLKIAEIFLKALAVDVDSISVHHWDNKGWGENPADFGNK